MENNLKAFNDAQLILELENRGYTMSFILSKEDVDIELGYINDERESDEQITLTEEDKTDILESIVHDAIGQYIHEMMSNAINELILSDYVEQ